MNKITQALQEWWSETERDYFKGVITLDEYKLYKEFADKCEKAYQELATSLHKLDE